MVNVWPADVTGPAIVTFNFNVAVACALSAPTVHTPVVELYVPLLVGSVDTNVKPVGRLSVNCTFVASVCELFVTVTVKTIG